MKTQLRFAEPTPQPTTAEIKPFAGMLQCLLPECDWDHILRLLRSTGYEYDAGLADFIENHAEEPG